MTPPREAEIKITLGAAEAGPALDRLDLRHRRATETDIWFCEHLRAVDQGPPRLSLAERGVIVRFRRRRGGPDDVTVKLRRPGGVQLHDDWPWDDGRTESKVEADWAGESHQVSASLKAEVDGRLIAVAAIGPAVSDALFSPAQRRWLRTLVMPRSELSSLRALGPVLAWQWSATHHRGLAADLAAEQWAVGPLVFLELSVRVAFEDAAAGQAELTAWVAERIGTPSWQTTKTAAVLGHLAAGYM